MSKKLFLLLAIIGVALISVSLIWARAHGRAAAPHARPQSESTRLVAGPGRVEPASEEIKLGSELSGKLKSVNVEEGAAIRRGQVLAVLENADYRAQVIAAEADVAARQADWRKVSNGARNQERSEAWSSVRAAEAVMNNAQAEMVRRQKLWAAGVISREELDRYTREYEVARARYQEAVEHHSLIDDRAREEDLSLAQANLKLAQARLGEARARYAKTFIVSPIDGTVLRKHHRNGESVSNSATAPDPVLTVGDKDILRVRVDVDETEIGKVHVGQRAYVTADALAGRNFWGRVVRVGEQLGRKNIRTDEPAERVDTKILETLVELDPGVQLPVGLRVDAFIVGDHAAVASAK